MNKIIFLIFQKIKFYKITIKLFLKKYRNSKINLKIIVFLVY